jgi:hypothetical protein
MSWAGDNKIYPAMDSLKIPEIGFDKQRFKMEMGRLNPSQKANFDRVYDRINAEFIRPIRA